MVETSMGRGGPAFQPTYWTMVLQAKDHSKDAVEELIKAYWKPVYFFVRRWGRTVEEAKDLTQGFFLEFLEREFLKEVTPERGRFRSFLLTTLRHYLINEGEKRRAQKRGGGKNPLPLDFIAAESEYAREPAAKEEPEAFFKKQWALTVLERALDALGRELPKERFQALRKHLSAGKTPSYEETAKELGMRAEELKSILHRARVRYRELIRQEVRSGVDTQDEVETEIRDLFKSL